MNLTVFCWLLTAASESKESEGLLEVPVFIRTRSSYETLDLKVSSFRA